MEKSAKQDSPAFQRLVSATILKLHRRSPFFATLALFATIHESATISTAATDGHNILIHQPFWDTLTPDQRLGVFTHEVLHTALLHVPRRGIRDPHLWNIAADIVVNGMLVKSGFALPSDHIRHKELEHLSVEEVYHLLLDNAASYEFVRANDLIFLGDPDNNAYKDLARHWQGAIQHAQTMAQTQEWGEFPTTLERELASFNASHLDWRSYLWRFLVRTPTDFQEYDRRFIGQGLYLDTLAGETVHVYLAVDTSSSIGQQVTDLFLDEVVGILHAYPHITATLYYVDTSCHGPYQLNALHETIPRPVGGGGTSFVPFFATVQQVHHETTSAICIYLTDGYGVFPTLSPAFPVLWVLSPGGLALNKLPFGEGVRLIPDP